MSPKSIKVLFQVAALYDIALGLAFALFYRGIFAWLGVDPPNHVAYVQLPGLLIAVFGVGFWFVSLDPKANATIVLLGVLMKIAYIVVVLGHWMGGSMPSVFALFAL